ncbi:hypothetical protein [Micromonospora sp. NPDC093277]|uniref:hypothetical protein n=1 Tax=Micromonospora sp. NPDC093277 TaxID=3364291 RepID=UPI003802ED67
MDDRDHRIDQHVRTAAPVNRRILAELTDRAMRESLLRRILVDAQPVTAATRRTRPGPRWALAAGVLALLVAGGAVLGEGWWHRPVTTPMVQPIGQDDVGTPSPPATTRADGGTASCIGASAENLSKYQDFAFDGTVVTIAPSPVTVAWLGYPTVDVTFAVQQWFRGPGGSLVTVRMLSPEVPNDDGLHYLGGYLPYAAGSRMLVSGGGSPSGTELQASGCGFTRHYRAADADIWARAFAATPFPSKPPATR